MRNVFATRARAIVLTQNEEYLFCVSYIDAVRILNEWTLLMKYVSLSKPLIGNYQNNKCFFRHEPFLRLYSDKGDITAIRYDLVTGVRIEYWKPSTSSVGETAECQGRQWGFMPITPEAIECSNVGYGAQESPLRYPNVPFKVSSDANILNELLIIIRDNYEATGNLLVSFTFSTTSPPYNDLHTRDMNTVDLPSALTLLWFRNAIAYDAEPDSPANSNALTIAYITSVKIVVDGEIFGVKDSLHMTPVEAITWLRHFIPCGHQKQV